MYNVLWLDDECGNLKIFQNRCKSYGLNLIPYTTKKAAMAALNENLERWDAILLDVEIYNEDENEVPSEEYFDDIKQTIENLKLKKAIPYFVSTGKEWGTFFRKNYKYYIKHDQDAELIQDMLDKIKFTKENQIKAKYQDVFEALADMKLPRETESILLDILLPLHYPGDYPMFESKHYYTQLRKEVEFLFRAFHRVGLVPDQCIPGGNVNLNQCSIYLSGKPAEHARVQYGGEGDRVVPEYIESIIKSILEFGNINSHTVDLEKADEDRIAEIFSRGRSNYLIFGLTLQLCEAIVWSSKHIALHGDKEKNLSSCRILPPKEENKSSLPQEIIDKYEGKIFDPEYDGELKVWHCGECYVQITSWVSERKMKLKNLAINSKDWMSHKYPYYAKYDKC